MCLPAPEIVGVVVLGTTGPVVEPVIICVIFTRESLNFTFFNRVKGYNLHNYQK